MSTEPPTSPATIEVGTPQRIKCATASPSCWRSIIAIPRARRRFPDGFNRRDARQPCAAVSLAAVVDYDTHRHGVGSYLSFALGTVAISKLGTNAAESRHDPLTTSRLLRPTPTASGSKNLELLTAAEIAGAESR